MLNVTPLRAEDPDRAGSGTGMSLTFRGQGAPPATGILTKA